MLENRRVWRCRVRLRPDMQGHALAVTQIVVLCATVHALAHALYCRTHCFTVGKLSVPSSSWLLVCRSNQASCAVVGVGCGWVKGCLSAGLLAGSPCAEAPCTPAHPGAPTLRHAETREQPALYCLLPCLEAYCIPATLCNCLGCSVPQHGVSAFVRVHSILEIPVINWKCLQILPPLWALCTV